MISQRTWRERTRGLRPPIVGTSIISSSPIIDASPQPNFFLIFSASGIGVRSR